MDHRIGKICVQTKNEKEFPDEIVENGPTLTAEYDIVATDLHGKVTFQASYKYSEGDCGMGTCGESYANDLNELDNAGFSNAHPEMVIFKTGTNPPHRGEIAGEVFFVKQDLTLWQR